VSEARSKPLDRSERGAFTLSEDLVAIPTAYLNTITSTGRRTSSRRRSPSTRAAASWSG